MRVFVVARRHARAASLLLRCVRTPSDANVSARRRCRANGWGEPMLLGRSCSRSTTGWRLARVILLLLCAPPFSSAQTMSVLRGRVFDESGAVLRGAEVSVRDDATGFAFSVGTGPDGRYSLVAIPAGTYAVEAAATGFRSDIIES